MYGYKIENGKIRVGNFNGELPEGWFDAPDKAERAVNPVPEPRPVLSLKRKKQ